MALLPLNNLSKVLPNFSGLLRSSHALIAFLALLCLLFFWLARGIDSPFLQNSPFILFALLLLVVIGRFAIKGPEADRAQPVVAVSTFETRILNIEPAAMESPQFLQLLKDVMKHRHPLPPPAGIIRGLASDPESIQEITPAEAVELAKKDNAITPGTGELNLDTGEADVLPEPGPLPPKDKPKP